ncbi:hypothetical protein G6F68_009375 [Rhizopus microsporus]|nr:hypothetical protein G6F68_009375 [Rhizopus microsporus]
MLACVRGSSGFWLAGAASDGSLLLALWAVAVAFEYISPMFGFAFPGMGRSHTRDWTIEGGHLAERCQLFVIVALGETLLATGGVLSEVEHWSGEVVSAVLATFAGTIAMWWLYFGISSRDATEAITHAEDPGRMGANFHYVHALLIAGIIATAVGNDLVMDHPGAARPVQARGLWTRAALAPVRCRGVGRTGRTVAADPSAGCRLADQRGPAGGGADGYTHEASPAAHLIHTGYGTKGVDSDLAIRTLIVAAVILPLVVVTGKRSNPLLLPGRTQLFLVLSALATGASWLFYFRALQSGELAKVAVVDKVSVVLVVVLATRK